MTQTHRCPDCTAPTEIGFFIDGNMTYMILEGELIGLSALPTTLSCPDCRWSLTGTLTNAVVDLHSYRITAGQFIPAQH